MGTSYYGHAIIGIAFNMPAEIELEEVIPSCEHPERIGNVFCPKCGTRVDDRTIMDPSEYWELREQLDEALPRNYIVAHNNYDDDAPYYVGYGVGGSYDYGREKTISLPNLDEVRATIKAALAEVGLDEVYDEKSFGLHSVVTAS